MKRRISCESGATDSCGLDRRPAAEEVSIVSIERVLRTGNDSISSTATLKAKRRIDKTRFHGRLLRRRLRQEGLHVPDRAYDRREGGLAGGIASPSRRLCVTANTSCPGRTFWQLTPGT